MRKAEQLEIRPATLTDLPDLLAMDGVTEDGPHWSESAWRHLLTGGGTGRAGVLLLGSPGVRELQGWIAGTVLSAVSEIESVLVLPARRGQGWGTFLMQHWLAWCTKQGASEVHLEVRASNLVALGLYRELGFMEQARRPQYYNHPMDDAVLMALHIQSDDAALLIEPQG